MATEKGLQVNCVRGYILKTSLVWAGEMRRAFHVSCDSEDSFHDKKLISIALQTWACEVALSTSFHFSPCFASFVLPDSHYKWAAPTPSSQLGPCRPGGAPSLIHCSPDRTSALLQHVNHFLHGNSIYIKSLCSAFMQSRLQTYFVTLILSLSHGHINSALYKLFQGSDLSGLTVLQAEINSAASASHTPWLLIYHYLIQGPKILWHY